MTNNFRSIFRDHAFDAAKVCVLPDIAKGLGFDPIVERLTATKGDTRHLTCLANIVMYDRPEMYRERAGEEDIMLESNDRLTIEQSK